VADQPLRLVIFDVDGTLVDSQAAILAAMAHAFGAAGLPVPPREAVLGIVGLSLPEAMAALAPGLSRAEAHDLAALYKAGHRAALHRTADAPLYPGARDTVGALDGAGFLLSAATGKSRAGLTRFLTAQGWDRLFLATQTADDAPSKPHPQMVLNCLAGTGVAPERTLMIGDTAFDMEMARAAGCRTIGVAWGYHAPERIRAAGAEVIAESFNEVPALVREMLG